MGKRFLITGASGQLGSEWVSYLEENAIEFVATDSKSLDITNLDSAKNFITQHNPNVVINCAAYTNVDRAEEEPDKAFAVNYEGIKNLSEICKVHNILLVHYSTDYVFPGSAEDKNNYLNGYDEDAKTNPIGVYGASKLKGEEAILEVKCDYLICRISWLCSSHGSNFLKTMLRLGKQNNQVRVVNDQFGSPTVTFDVVEATMQLIESQLRGVFHISCEEQISWYDFARMIFTQAEIESTVEPVSSNEFKTKARRPLFSKLNTGKFKKMTNHPGFKTLDGIKRIFNEMEQSNL